MPTLKGRGQTHVVHIRSPKLLPISTDLRGPRELEAARQLEQARADQALEREFNRRVDANVARRATGSLTVREAIVAAMEDLRRRVA
jgi:hypothetical protein